MKNWWSEIRTFLREYRTNFKHTGAVMPSGACLGRALARFVRERQPVAVAASAASVDLAASVGGGSACFRILEVGPGTGAVTRHIASALRAGDALDLCELNPSFVAMLRERLVDESPFCDVADQVRIFHHPIEELPHDVSYDLIISGLPLNNFNVAEVEHILGLFERLLKPSGTLSFFEYIGIRKMRAVVSDAPGRERLRGIGRAMDGMLARGEIHRDRIWPNVPPAYVHHVRFGKG
ncbi:MAG: methyltransferase domain-containing protein [Planctomycetia bacterium]|nr:methyltransferase domain-containing protein [Planctomycetia bacterium]